MLAKSASAYYVLSHLTDFYCRCQRGMRLNLCNFCRYQQYYAAEQDDKFNTLTVVGSNTKLFTLDYQHTSIIALTIGSNTIAKYSQNKCYYNATLLSILRNDPALGALKHNLAARLWLIQKVVLRELSHIIIRYLIH